LGINPNDGSANVNDYLIRDSISFPVIMDRTGEIWHLFCEGFSNKYVILDKDMTIRYMNDAYDEEEIIREIEKLL